MENLNKRLAKALASYTKAKSYKYEQMLAGLISESEFSKWVGINKAEIDNAIEMLATKEQSWLDSHAE